MVEALFVHLGEEVPKHLISNLGIVQANFPQQKIHLIVNTPPSDKVLDLPRVEVHVLEVSDEINSILNELAPDKKFREGFWRLTLERLLILEKFHKSMPDTKFLHIESDIFLFPNFPFDKFDSLKKISWIKVSSTRDVAAIVYLPNSMETTTFIKRMVNVLISRGWLDDMEMLSTLMNEFGTEYEYLPSLNPSQMELKSSSHSSKKTNRQLTSNFELFDGIFDGAQLGIWLTGWDPRNSYGFTRVRDESHISDASGFLNPKNVTFLLDDSNCLHYFSEGRGTNVYMLHIHSKSLKFFSEGWAHQFKRLINKNFESTKVVDFNFKMLIQLLVMNRRNGTLLRYILNSSRITKSAASSGRKLFGIVWNWRSGRQSVK
jgi:hypothetical protein